MDPFCNLYFHRIRVNGIDDNTLSLLRALLTRSQITVRLCNNKVVREAQAQSLLCVTPGIGPRQFAQLLKNGVLHIVQERNKRGRPFADVPGYPIFELDADRIVDSADRVLPLLDEVIQDDTNTKILFFDGGK